MIGWIHEPSGDIWPNLFEAHPKRPLSKSWTLLRNTAALQCMVASRFRDDPVTVSMSAIIPVPSERNMPFKVNTRNGTTPSSESKKSVMNWKRRTWGRSEKLGLPPPNLLRRIDRN
jgi:hypothetical protein